MMLKTLYCTGHLALYCTLYLYTVLVTTRCASATWTAHPGPRLPLKQIGGTTHTTAADKEAPAQPSKGPPSAPVATTTKVGWC